MNEVDIVIPWLNPTEKWFDEYKKYCENESPARIRNMNTMFPVLKSILKNLSFVRYIWLIVYDEEQIPNWDILKNEKIKFVFHKDILPNEFLPNFNSILVNNYITNIDGLSENFIFSNDDMFFIKPLKKEFFFIDNTPVHSFHNLVKWNDKHVNTYAEIINNSVAYIEKLSGMHVIADDEHMPIALCKSRVSEIIKKLKNELYTAFTNSKIRKSKNICPLIISFTMDEIEKQCINTTRHNAKLKAIHLSDKTKISEINEIFNTCDIACINDSEGLSNSYADKLSDYISSQTMKMF